MKFDTYIPCSALQPFIKNFIIAEKDCAETYKVLPGTSVVMGFQYRGRLSFTDNGSEHKLAVSGVTGLIDSYRVFRNAADTGTVLVVFKEAQASAFFNEPIHELFRESLSLDNFVRNSELSLVEEQLGAAKNDKHRISIIENFLLGKLKITTADGLVIAAIEAIRQSKGTIRIADLAAKLYTSQSPLEKKFRKAVGVAPKKFSSIVRFENLVNQGAQKQSLTSRSYEAGYFDQAHFIKDFKAFTGQTPEDFFLFRK